MSRGVRWLAALVLWAGLAGCGFQLRGAAGTGLADVLPVVYLEGVDTAVGIGDALAEALRANRVRVLEQRDPQSPVLRVSPPRESELLLSVDRDLRVREYALVTTMDYELKRGGDADQVLRDAVQVRRDQVNDPLQVLGSDRERRRLRQEMHEELVQSLILKLRVQLGATRG